MALELSDNQGILAEAFSWTEKNSREIQVFRLLLILLNLTALSIIVAV